MSKNKIKFKITISNWDKHNGSKKKNHRYFLFENRFFQDESISQLKPIEALFYIYLLTIASDLTSDSFEITTQSIPKSLRINNTYLSNYLHSLQSLQLVTYEKIDLFNNTKEKKTIENKRKEKNISTEAENLLPVVTEKPKKEIVNFKVSSTLEVPISRDLISSWMDTFPKEFVEEEMKKARSWILSNPQKAPKSAWGKFFNGWLVRGWERYRTTLKSNPTKLTEADMSDILGGGL